MNYVPRAMLLGVGALAVVSCANTAPIISSNSAETSGAGGKSSVSAYSQFPDIPVPSGAKINTEKTLVFGTKPWYGQLAITASASANAMFDFYRENLGTYGWQEITAVRAPTSILTYATSERVLAIAIQSATLTGSDITVTVSPRGQSSTSSGGTLPPTGAPAPVQRLNQ